MKCMNTHSQSTLAIMLEWALHIISMHLLCSGSSGCGWPSSCKRGATPWWWWRRGRRRGRRGDRGPGCATHCVISCNAGNRLLQFWYRCTYIHIVLRRHLLLEMCISTLSLHLKFGHLPLVSKDPEACQWKVLVPVDGSANREFIRRKGQWALGDILQLSWI